MGTSRTASIPVAPQRDRTTPKRRGRRSIRTNRRPDAPGSRQLTLLATSWLAALSALHLATSVTLPLDTRLIALSLVALMAAGNLVTGWLDPTFTGSTTYGTGLAILQTLCISAIWLIGDAEAPVELVLIPLALIHLAVAGLKLNELSLVSMAICVFYVVAVYGRV